MTGRLPVQVGDRDLQHLLAKAKTYGLVERDPEGPVEGYTWIRSDLTPPELRVKVGGAVWKLPFFAEDYEERVLAIGELDVPKPIYQYLTTDGNGTVALASAIGVYSAGVPGVFKISPSPGEVFYIRRMLAFIEDTGGAAASDYGNIAGGLPNGVRIERIGGPNPCDLDAGKPIQTNADWAEKCYDAIPLIYGAGNDFIPVRFTFGNAGYPIKLIGDLGEYLAVTLTDDTSALVTHHFVVEGWQEGA